MLAAALQFPDIGPEIFAITIGSFRLALRWYALAYIAGILIGWRIIVATLRRPALWQGGAPMTEGQLEQFITYAVIGIILGGRLGFVLIYQPAYYLQNPGQVLAIWNGGMSFHGGFAGVVLAAILFARVQKVRLSGLSDALAICVAPGLLLGRAANFINAELWGRPTDLPWGVIFPGAAAQDCAGVTGLCARHPSQLYEAGLEGLVLGTILIGLAFFGGGLKRPWAMTGLFLAGYGLSRFTVELFRQADAQFITPDNPMGHVIQFGSAGLSMGQLLSLPMIVLGVIVFVTAWRRSTTPA